MYRKTKRRAHQLYFGTNLSTKLPVVFENGSIEVRDHDFVLAPNRKHNKHEEMRGCQAFGVSS